MGLIKSTYVRPLFDHLVFKKKLLYCVKQLMKLHQTVEKRHWYRQLVMMSNIVAVQDAPDAHSCIA